MGALGMAVLFVAWLLAWVACVVAKELLCARLGLSGADPNGASARELVVRRALRRLLALNCWLMWPVGIPASVLLLHGGGSEDAVTWAAAKPFLGILAFTVAVPMLVRQMRRFERERTAPSGIEVPPSIWIEGP